MGVLGVVYQHPALVAAAGFFICLEGHYLVRVVSRLFLDRFVYKRVPVLDTHRLYSICAPTDIDLNLHMNNARYVREMDFGRWGFYCRAGLYSYQLWKRHRIHVLQTSAMFRFRKEVNFLMLFRIETRLVYWDDTDVYFEQKLITLHDNRARCVSFSQQRVLGELTARQLVSTGFGHDTAPPAPSESLKAFMEANQAYRRDLAVVENREKM